MKTYLILINYINTTMSLIRDRKIENSNINRTRIQNHSLFAVFIYLSLSFETMMPASTISQPWVLINHYLFINLELHFHNDVWQNRKRRLFFVNFNEYNTERLRVRKYDSIVKTVRMETAEKSFGNFSNCVEQWSPNNLWL